MMVLRKSIDYMTIAFRIQKELVLGPEEQNGHLDFIKKAFILTPSAQCFFTFGKTILSDVKNGVLIIQTTERIFIHLKGRYWIKRKAFSRMQSAVMSIATKYSAEFYLTRLDVCVDFTGEVMVFPMADNRRYKWTGLSKETYYQPYSLYSKDLVNRRQIMGCTRWVLQIYRKDIQLAQEKDKAKRHYYREVFRDVSAKSPAISRMELRLKHEQSCAKWGPRILTFSNSSELAAEALREWGQKHQFLIHRQGEWKMHHRFKQLFQMPKTGRPK